MVYYDPLWVVFHPHIPNKKPRGPEISLPTIRRQQQRQQQQQQHSTSHLGCKKKLRKGYLGINLFLNCILYLYMFRMFIIIFIHHTCTNTICCYMLFCLYHFLKGPVNKPLTTFSHQKRWAPRRIFQLLADPVTAKTFRGFRGSGPKKISVEIPGEFFLHLWVKKNRQTHVFFGPFFLVGG